MHKELRDNLKPGTLVRQKIVEQQKDCLYLTPLREDPEDLTNWIEWRSSDLGIILPCVSGQAGIVVMTPTGTGMCFYDEVVKIV